MISGTIGATFYLFGIGLLYSMTGTLNMSDMDERIVTLYDNNIVKLGTLFIFVGLSIRIALFPLSRWLVQDEAFTQYYKEITQALLKIFRSLGDSFPQCVQQDAWSEDHSVKVTVVSKGKG
ncbi:hypothetical protein DICVIV_13908 [Dictyocaulus viviparus]|uniref:NADH:ubiquinone reductase (H(+)-translocating) n=1 Tax=Dictyocaulus viviparus TaxID=29172 RepID=A0A0D8X6I6_DICVI|nr:hypothetical protein DICVIV_13908 [Dictyocaulus viviparus]